jgi:hypothetical protein
MCKAILKKKSAKINEIFHQAMIGFQKFMLGQMLNEHHGFNRGLMFCMGGEVKS